MLWAAPAGAESLWPAPAVLSAAELSWQCAQRRRQTRSPLVTVIDYSLPSSVRRLWVLDLARGEVLLHTWVTHGVRSGTDEVPASFGDGQRRSPLGVHLTGGTFKGRRGRSLRLYGLEPGINGRSARRGIILHGAPYASEDQRNLAGALGTSWGCPAVDPEVADELIDLIKGGSVLVLFGDDARWMKRSRYLDGACPPTRKKRLRRKKPV